MFVMARYIDEHLALLMKFISVPILYQFALIVDYIFDKL